MVVSVIYSINLNKCSKELTVDHILICGDFNDLDIDTSSTLRLFTFTQTVDFPIREDRMLDLTFTDIFEYIDGCKRLDSISTKY